MTRWIILVAWMQCAGFASAAEQPNVVLILVDDAGLMDFGGYGGEARTPNINALADAGIRFSNYHTSPLCAPSRAMLLTGVDNHLTGVGTIPEVLTDEQAKAPEYAMHFNQNIKTVADKLRQAGYRTYMTGKWHLGSEGGNLPIHHGFDKSFALDASGADNWEQKSYMPYYDHAPWYEDGEPADLPEEFYSSKFIVDQMIEYIGSSDDAPFFAYLAFQAVHIPIQAPREFTDRYEGVYGEGWQQLQKSRFSKGKVLGLIPEDAEMPKLPVGLRSWDSLTVEDKRYYERSMMVNAGMLEAMDYHIGRLLDYLKEQSLFEDTVFIITSDNGPEFNDPAANSLMQRWMQLNDYHNDVDRLGERGSLAAIGPEWAVAAASPGDLFKFYATEGGLRVPLIVSGVGPGAAGFNHALSFVVDITPTILDLAGVKNTIRNDGVAMYGRSLTPILRGTSIQVYRDYEAVGMEVSGNSALFKGDYKLARNTLPHGDAQWRLFHILSDPGETMDLSFELPALKETMLSDYQSYADAMHVIEMPADFNPTEQLAANVYDRLLKRYLVVLVAVILLLILLVAGTVQLIRKSSRSRRRT